MMEYFAGVDIGSTMTKVVVMDGEKDVSWVIGPTGAEHRRLAHQVMVEALKRAAIPFSQVTYVVATGYGRLNVPFADKQITEISCHARGVAHLLPSVRTVIDIGGQDCKGIKLSHGRAVDFIMNDKCAAGTGRFIEVMADSLGVALEDMGRLSLTAKRIVPVSNTCTVFAEQEIVSHLAKGVPREDLVAGLHDAIAARVWGMVRRLKVEKDVAVTGGGAKNIGLIKALELKIGSAVLIPPEPLLTGAMGAALLGRDLVHRALDEGSSLTRGERRFKEAVLFS